MIFLFCCGYALLMLAHCFIKYYYRNHTVSHTMVSGMGHDTLPPGDHLRTLVTLHDNLDT